LRDGAHRQPDVIFQLHVNLVQILRIHRTAVWRSEMFWLKGNIGRKASVRPSVEMVLNWCAARSWIKQWLYAMTMQI